MDRYHEVNTGEERASILGGQYFTSSLIIYMDQVQTMNSNICNSGTQDTGKQNRIVWIVKYEPMVYWVQKNDTTEVIKIERKWRGQTTHPG